MECKIGRITCFDEKCALQVPRFQLSRIWFVVSIEAVRMIARKPVKIFVKCAQVSTNAVSRDEVTWLGWMIDDSHKIVPIKFCRT
jgi:hypothetical protein